MANLLRISDASALALHTVEVLARNPDRFVTAQDIAEQLDVSEHHLQKVHQRLSRAGVIRSARGPRGGVQLAKPPGEIRLMDIYETMEGRFDPDQCLLGRPTCARAGCILGNLSEQVNGLVKDYFSKTTVADLAE